MSLNCIELSAVEYATDDSSEEISNVTRLREIRKLKLNRSRALFDNGLLIGEEQAMGGPLWKTPRRRILTGLMLVWVGGTFLGGCNNLVDRLAKEADDKLPVDLLFSGTLFTDRLLSGGILSIDCLFRRGEDL